MNFGYMQKYFNFEHENMEFDKDLSYLGYVPPTKSLISNPIVYNTMDKKLEHFLIEMNMKDLYNKLLKRPIKDYIEDILLFKILAKFLIMKERNYLIKGENENE